MAGKNRKTIKRKPLAIWADALTLFRGTAIPFGLLIVRWVGIKSFTWLFGALVLGWITDILDGKMARKANQSSWIGEIEGACDQSMLVGATIYILISFSLNPLLVIAVSAWTFLAILSIYGSIRHKAKSFIFAIEPEVAVALTLSILVYVVVAQRTLSDFLILAAGFAFGLPNIHSSGFAARERVTQGVSVLPEDLRRVWKKTIKSIRKRNNGPF